MSTQWRAGFAGPLGLDYVALEKVALWLGIDMDVTMLRKIRLLETHMLNDLYGDKDKTSGKNKACRNANACAMCTKVCRDRVS